MVAKWTKWFFCDMDYILSIYAELFRDFCVIKYRRAKVGSIQSARRYFNETKGDSKLQRGIGYDYDAAVRKCQKLRGKKPRNADVGEEAMVLAVKRGFEQAQAKANKPSSPGQNDDKEVNRYE